MYLLIGFKHQVSCSVLVHPAFGNLRQENCYESEDNMHYYCTSFIFISLIKHCHSKQLSVRACSCDIFSRSQSVSEKRVMAETCFRRDPKQTGKESCLLTFPGFLSYRVHSHSPVGRMMPPTVNWAFLGQLRW